MPRYTPTIPFEDCYGSVGNRTYFHWKKNCYYKKKAYTEFKGTDAQLAQTDLHHRALEAWRSIPWEEQKIWNRYAVEVPSKRAPYDKRAHISGYNLFVSAYHGFATLGNVHVPEPRAFEKFPPFAVEVGGASVVEGMLVLPVSVVIEAAFTPERFRLLAKIQLTRPGKGRNPGKMRNVLADRTCGSSSVNLFIDPSIWSLNQQQYQVHARFILLDTVTGYRSQYHQQSTSVSLLCCYDVFSRLFQINKCLKKHFF